MARSTITVLLACCASFGITALTSAQSAPPPPVPPTFQQKLAAIIRLEDERSLRDPAPAPPPVVAPVAPRRRGRAAPVPPPAPPAPPDLTQMLTDGEGRVRRRAALAIGRVGRAEGVPPLVALLKDPEPEVRQMAAFAIGLIGDRAGVEPLIAALQDPSPIVKGGAAEGLGLIGDVSAVPALSRLVADFVAAGVLTPVPADVVDVVRDTPAAVCRLALYALVRLKSYEGVASAVLDPSGQPRAHWWPIAYALQRLDDPRGLKALTALASDPHPYTRAFAAKGLGTSKDPIAVETLITLLAAPEKTVVIEAIRALGRLRASAAGPALTRLLRARDVDPHVRLEAVAVLGAVGGATATDTLIDFLGDRSPAVRAAAVRAFGSVDADTFMTVLSGLDVDDDWGVRAALATTLGTLPADTGLPRLRMMLDDADARVVPAVLAAIAKIKPPDIATVLAARLESPDAVVRSAAAQAIADAKPPNVEASLIAAYQRGQADSTYVARAAALTALAAYGVAAATPTLTAALEDAEWAVRVRAAMLLNGLDPSRRVEPRGTAPHGNATAFTSPQLLEPPFSTQAFIDTSRGTITIELAMLDAPVTVNNFVTLARRGFFDGSRIHRVVPDFVIQAGDPRGDGEGGPGYAIRDELNQRPYLRGTVGMALDWEDTGGSQFFIAHSPQPHLDAKYTAFGRVLAGMEVVDQIEQWDVIQRVRIWDGVAVTP